MIDAFVLYNKFCGNVNTTQGGHARPNRNFISWVNDIRLEIFEEEYKAWEKSQIITDRLSPYLVTVNILVTGVSNQMWDVVKLPQGYEHFSSLRIWKRGEQSCGCGGVETIDGSTGKLTECATVLSDDEIAALKAEADANLCEIAVNKVTSNRWAALCSHATMSPKKTGVPKCTQYEGGLKIAPKGTGVVIMDYFRLPTPATFEYTIINPNTEDEYIQYNPASKKLEFSELLIPEFLDRLQKKYGTANREPVLYQQGEHERTTKP